MQQFVLKKKPTALILALKDASQAWYPSKLAKASGASYVYVVNSLEGLQAAGWVRFEPRGRLKLVSLTERGMQAAAALDELVRRTGPAPGATAGSASAGAAARIGEAEPASSPPSAHAKADSADRPKEKEAPKV